ncbi:hypothetical protein LTSEINV_6176 [Salmonella enterica subsp. enterica serovar Inverness str. R8-3668]|uniref:Uncharacterized protein n=1 Tax=Salmonella enterica subsp. enterica serovar Inverness str. R8-3668 TaxID=913075 RepID=G5NLS3_SALET|nr:hypothetical protein LTSEINV_6176 [Salmonella enterica subsp. enterica serovar Inverness str. R8-3668]
MLSSILLKLLDFIAFATMPELNLSGAVLFVLSWNISIS